MKKIMTSSFNETRNFAKDFAKSVKKGDILCFYGNLGSGKTTFIQGLAEGFGIENRIISPTFIIVRSYKLKSSIFYHVDLYRTASVLDLQSVGLEEIINDKDAIVAIEWAEKLGSLLPQKRIQLKFENKGEDKREIEIKKYE